jgi:hypothetical protein
MCDWNRWEPCKYRLRVPADGSACADSSKCVTDCASPRSRSAIALCHRNSRSSTHQAHAGSLAPTPSRNSESISGKSLSALSSPDCARARLSRKEQRPQSRLIQSPRQIVSAAEVVPAKPIIQRHDFTNVVMNRVEIIGVAKLCVRNRHQLSELSKLGKPWVKAWPMWTCH